MTKWLTQEWYILCVILLHSWKLKKNHCLLNFWWFTMCIFTTKFPKDECIFNTSSAIMRDKPEEYVYDPFKHEICMFHLHSFFPSVKNLVLLYTIIIILTKTSYEPESRRHPWRWNWGHLDIWTHLAIVTMIMMLAFTTIVIQDKAYFKVKL